MPAINPSTLNEKIDAIFSPTLKAGSFSRGIEELLNFYADRTKRTTAAAAALETAPMMHVPVPVLRSLCAKIHQRSRHENDEWLDAAERLWRSGLRETRLVAICMLSEAPADGVIEVASTWAAESEDRHVLRSLATEGIEAWRQSEPDRVLDYVAEWLETESTRMFALIVLQQSVKDGSLNDFPAVFDLLSGLAARVRGLRLEALQALLIALAQRSPAETTAFLMGEIASGDARTQRLARTVSASLPAPFQSQLRQII